MHGCLHRQTWIARVLKAFRIENKIDALKYSLNVYDSDYYTRFSPTNAFDKWALVEVSSFDDIPQGMEPFNLVEGLYAVFHYKGLNTDPSIFQYIYSEWLPASEYRSDDRPHFEILGEKYQNNDPESEEEIWIAIKSKD